MGFRGFRVLGNPTVDGGVHSVAVECEALHALTCAHSQQLLQALTKLPRPLFFNTTKPTPSPLEMYVLDWTLLFDKMATLY
jgi:hypothetical protein